MYKWWRYLFSLTVNLLCLHCSLSRMLLEYSLHVSYLLIFDLLITHSVLKNSVIWSKHLRKLPKKRDTTWTCSKIPTKRRKIHLLTLLFVWIGKDDRYSEFYRWTSWSRSRNTNIQESTLRKLLKCIRGTVGKWYIRSSIPRKWCLVQCVFSFSLPRGKV